MLQYISNSAHYKEVLLRVQSVKKTLWIGKHCKKCKRRDYCSAPIA